VLDAFDETPYVHRHLPIVRPALKCFGPQRRKGVRDSLVSLREAQETILPVRR
jgi:hypothetical protein